jgi:hypothetical protein
MLTQDDPGSTHATVISMIAEASAASRPVKMTYLCITVASHAAPLQLLLPSADGHLFRQT